MNLDLLNDGVPNTKTWLNPVCNVITCNSINVMPDPILNQVFNINFTGSNVLSASITNPCTTVGILNSNMNVLTNRYTAVKDCFLSVALSFLVNYTALGASIVVDLGILVNGVQTYIFTRDVKANLGGVIGTFPVQVNGVLKLNTGDIVSLQINATGGGSGFTYSNVTYSGVVI